LRLKIARERGRLLMSWTAIRSLPIALRRYLSSSQKSQIWPPQDAYNYMSSFGQTLGIHSHVMTAALDAKSVTGPDD
jgi:hypothetical protein